LEIESQASICMARYQVILAYNGSRYQGFQRQTNRPTVQGAVEDALRKIGWQGKTLLGAGRTDSGVHASGQVIAFDLDWAHPESALQAALNAHLPDDISVRSVQLAKDDFHPRYAAVARSYRYALFCDPVRNPLKELLAWRVWPPLELQMLNRSAGLLQGAHDFAAFGSPLHKGGSTIRTVFRAAWQAENDGMVFEISANAFLFRMVRRLVYVQVMVALGRLEMDCISASLQLPGSCECQGLAPAHGLTLVQVHYGS
jgi:tRNA pseudouridine38-40 synthase